MNKAAIKKYAVTARRKLIEAVAQKMRYFGCDEKRVLTENEAAQKLANDGVYLDESQKHAYAALSSRVRTHGFQSVVEEVAYTWFNRFAALRFMEVNGYLPSGIRVLSSGDWNRLEPVQNLYNSLKKWYNEKKPQKGVYANARKIPE